MILVAESYTILIGDIITFFHDTIQGVSLYWVAVEVNQSKSWQKLN